MQMKSSWHTPSQYTVLEIGSQEKIGLPFPVVYTFHVNSFSFHQNTSSDSGEDIENLKSLLRTDGRRTDGRTDDALWQWRTWAFGLSELKTSYNNYISDGYQMYNLRIVHAVPFCL